jgi:hypothetical protein
MIHSLSENFNSHPLQAFIMILYIFAIVFNFLRLFEILRAFENPDSFGNFR